MCVRFYTCVFRCFLHMYIHCWQRNAKTSTYKYLFDSSSWLHFILFAFRSFFFLNFGRLCRSIEYHRYTWYVLVSVLACCMWFLFFFFVCVFIMRSIIVVSFSSSIEHYQIKWKVAQRNLACNLNTAIWLLCSSPKKKTKKTKTLN